jgi:5,5'-dehydrodivanillate O-demethylase
MRIEGVEQTHVSCYAFPTVNRFTLPPVAGSHELVQALIYRVPVDDTLTLLYFVRFYPSETRSFVTEGLQPTQPGVYRPDANDWWGIDFNDQDRMAIEQQGVVCDRTAEHLEVSDRGITLLRQLLREALAAVEVGQDPPGVIRDAAEDEVIVLGAQADMYAGTSTRHPRQEPARV